MRARSPTRVGPSFLAGLTFTLTLTAALAAVLLRSPLALAEAPEAPRVLLVGNSYTRFNMMPAMLERLAASAGAPLRVEASVKQGATLRRHWMKLDTRARIQSGGYRFVVIQDHSLRPLDNPSELQDYGARFIRAATAAGAQPILLETWARSERTRFYQKRGGLEGPAQMLESIATAYGALAAREGASVAPVGHAFSRTRSLAPEIELYRDDGTHPSWAGSYLAACTLLGAIQEVDPRTATYVPWELPAEDARKLRELAAEALAAKTAASLAL